MPRAGDCQGGVLATTLRRAEDSLYCSWHCTGFACRFLAASTWRNHLSPWLAFAPLMLDCAIGTLSPWRTFHKTIPVGPAASSKHQRCHIYMHQQNA